MKKFLLVIFILLISAGLIFFCYTKLGKNEKYHDLKKVRPYLY